MADAAARQNRIRLTGALSFSFLKNLRWETSCRRPLTRKHLAGLGEKKEWILDLLKRGLVKPLVLAVRFFTTKRVMSQAAALTYSTLLATVPILAVLFAIARGFGYDRYVGIWLSKALAGQPQVAEFITGFVENYLAHTKSGIFLGFGLILMLYTVLMLVSNIERTFNEIWNVKHQRSPLRVCTDYLAMFFLMPIFIVVVSGVSIFLATIAKRMPDFLLLGPSMRLLIDSLPYMLMVAAFIALYVFMPNTHVKLRCAIFPGILAGVAMQWLQFVYIHSQVWLSSYNAIYGSFAALPLFMLWVQISWTICLFGAELTYIYQHFGDFDYGEDYSTLSHRTRMQLSASVMAQVCRWFGEGPQGHTSLDIAKATGISSRLTEQLLNRLVHARLLDELTPDDGSLSTYKPAEDPHNLTVGVMIDRLEQDGTTIALARQGVLDKRDRLLADLATDNQ